MFKDNLCQRLNKICCYLGLSILESILRFSHSQLGRLLPNSNV
jgi:hypothetical protein